MRQRRFSRGNFVVACKALADKDAFTAEELSRNMSAPALAFRYNKDAPRHQLHPPSHDHGAGVGAGGKGSAGLLPEVAVRTECRAFELWPLPESGKSSQDLGVFVDQWSQD